MLSLIGKYNDSEISRRTGVSADRIANARVKLGIAPVRYHIPVAPGLIESLGTMPDQEVATKFGRALKWVRKERAKRKIPKYTGLLLTSKLEGNAELLALLGTCSDRSLGARFGTSGPTIRALRERHGIAVFRGEEVRANKEMWEQHRDEAMALLGKVPDIELARRFGGYQCRYSYLRKKAGIPAFNLGNHLSDPVCPSASTEGQ
ncbi:hypothetical protein [Pseudomonas aeruginosa]|uniref:hypothetical protein n=1 Tax=Pseudomonas aeruginosa TaxID=287 RepID=UPI0034E07D1F